MILNFVRQCNSIDSTTIFHMTIISIRKTGTHLVNISMCNVCTISGCLHRVIIVCCTFSKDEMTFGISKRFLFKHWIRIFFSELWFITSTEWKNMVRWCGFSIGKLQYCEWYKWCYYCQFLPKNRFIQTKQSTMKLTLIFSPNFTWSVWHYCWVGVWCSHSIVLPIGNNQRYWNDAMQIP